MPAKPPPVHVMPTKPVTPTPAHVMPFNNKFAMPKPLLSHVCQACSRHAGHSRDSSQDGRQPRVPRQDGHHAWDSPHLPLIHGPCPPWLHCPRPHCSTVLVLCHAMIQILFPYMGLALRPSPSSTSTPPPSWTFWVLFWVGCYVRASAAILRGFVSYLGFLIFYFYVLPCFMFLACVSWPSCDDVMCYSCLCVMLWLVALVMCLVSHWLFVSCDPYCLEFIALMLPLGVFDLKWQ